MNEISKNKFLVPLITVTALFFMLGFITCLNDILVPYLKSVFSLNYFQSNLVQLAFFIAYFVVSLLYFVVSAVWYDPILRIGYKNTIVVGFLIASLACFLLSCESNSPQPTFGSFLFDLFLLGTGFAFLQIAANPLVSIMGSPDTASSRLNLSQAFNSLGTTLAPIIGGYLVFNLLKGEETTVRASVVQMPYLVLSALLLLLALAMFFTKIPQVTSTTDDFEYDSVGALRHPHLVLGMLGIFFYVGAEVAIGSNLVNYMHDSYRYESQLASALLSFYWGGAMIGRFMGAISMSQMESRRKYPMMFLSAVLVCSLLLFAVFSSLNMSLEESMRLLSEKQVYLFFIIVCLNYVMFLVANSKPSKTLAFFAVTNICLILLMLLMQGVLSLWMILSVGLFNSIMFSNIFTLGIDGLGKYTSQGSSLLVMMILGGAVVPPLQGFLADSLGDAHYAFALPLLCYAYIAWYGFVGCHIGKEK